MKSFVNRYATVAKNFEGTTLTAEELKDRRAHAKTEQGRRRRGLALKATGLALTAAVAFSGAPKKGFDTVTDSAKSGANQATTEIRTDVKLFGASVGDQVNSVADTAGNVLDNLGGGQDKMAAGQYSSEGLSAEDVRTLGTQLKAGADAGLQDNRVLEREMGGAPLSKNQLP